MKKMAAGVSCLVFLFCASVCSAAYLIHLKDGRDIVTHEYWEEGSQIKIKQYDGVVGIPKADVSSIEETDEVRTIVVKNPPKKEPQEANEKAETPQQKENKEAKKENSGDVNEKPEQLEKEDVSKEKNPLLEEFDFLKKRFEKVESMAKQELSQFDKALRDLRNKIIKAGLAGPYANQMFEILDMGNKVEEVYKKKDQ